MKRFLQDLFRAAVRAADPAVCVPPHLPPRPRGRLVVIGAGKAAASMARAVERHYGNMEGVAVVPYGHAVPCRSIAVLEAGHPYADGRSVTAARKILTAVSGLTKDDLVLALISGGGSAALALPARGVTLADKRRIAARLMDAGAPIGEINLVRACLSAVKGGRLLDAARPARVRTLVISDVPGDDPSLVASGPTVPGRHAGAAALAVLAQHGVRPGARVRACLEDVQPQTAARRADHKTIVVASPRHALLAAARQARKLGYRPLILGDALEGESREVAAVHAGIAASVRAHGDPVMPPAVLLSGGETTVTRRGPGRGGPNTEFALALALHLAGRAKIHAIACDTDGIDGTGGNAGAIVTPRTLGAAQRLGLDARDYLDRNDSHGFFSAAGGLVVTGPTLTNVNDFRAIVAG